jgi:hypothetical protein
MASIRPVTGVSPTITQEEMSRLVANDTATILERRIGLTRHKISDREPGKAAHAVEVWTVNTQNVRRRLARGSLHRLVRWFGA